MRPSEMDRNASRAGRFVPACRSACPPFAAGHYAASLPRVPSNESFIGRSKAAAVPSAPTESEGVQ
jgi:hypothetical protein